MDSWTCSRCDQVHKEAPHSFSFDASWPWHTTPPLERERHGLLTEDYCTLFDPDFFVRGCLEVPILGETNPFVWGILVSLSKDNFERERSLAKSPERTQEPPYFGWLCSRIQIYPDTLLLKTHVHTREVGTRPFIELEPTGHPLALEQRNGITRARVRKIAELSQHKWIHPLWDKQGLYGDAS